MRARLMTSEERSLEQREPELLGYCQFCKQDIYEGDPHWESFDGDLICDDCFGNIERIYTSAERRPEE